MKTFKFRLITAVLVSLASVALAADLRQVEVIGSGLTKQEAVYAVLIEAVRQVNGVKVASDTRTSFKYKEVAFSEQGKAKEGISAENNINKNIHSRSKGYVEKYEILDSQESDGHWEVKLLAFIPKYKTPGRSNGHIL